MCVRLFDFNGKFLANSLETINLHGKSRKKKRSGKKKCDVHLYKHKTICKYNADIIKC